MNKIKSVDGIENPYVKRILTNIIDKDPMKLLPESPRRIKRAMRGLTLKQLQKQPGRRKWSIAQIVAHLADAELAMGYRLRKGVAESGCIFQAYDENKWADNLRYASSDPKQKLELFSQLRKAHLTLLKSLKPDEWRKFGIHEERGKETVERVVQMITGHDVNHVRRIEEIRMILLKAAKR